MIGTNTFTNGGPEKVNLRPLPSWIRYSSSRQSEFVGFGVGFIVARTFFIATLLRQMLIVAAPTLLAACRLALSRIESDIESEKMKTSEGKELRLAIAIATRPFKSSDVLLAWVRADCDCIIAHRVNFPRPRSMHVTYTNEVLVKIA